MKRILFTLLLLGATVPAWSEDSPAIGQPTIFWRNNEWEVFQNGRWIAYAEAAKEKAAFAAAEARAAEVTAAEPETPATAGPENPAAPDNGNMQTNDVDSPWPYGYVMDLPTSGDAVKKHRHGHKPHVPGFGQLGLPIGQPNLAIGQPNFTPGQMTPGIGQQPTLGQPKSAVCPPKSSGQTSGQRLVQSPTGQHAFGTGQHAGVGGPR